MDTGIRKRRNIEECSRDSSPEESKSASKSEGLLLEPSRDRCYSSTSSSEIDSGIDDVRPKKPKRSLSEYARKRKVC